MSCQSVCASTSKVCVRTYKIWAEQVDLKKVQLSIHTFFFTTSSLVVFPPTHTHTLMISFVPTHTCIQTNREPSHPPENRTFHLFTCPVLPLTSIPVQSVGMHMYIRICMYMCMVCTYIHLIRISTDMCVCPRTFINSFCSCEEGNVIDARDLNYSVSCCVSWCVCEGLLYGIGFPSAVYPGVCVRIRSIV